MPVHEAKVVSLGVLELAGIDNYPQHCFISEWRQELAQLNEGIGFCLILCTASHNEQPTASLKDTQEPLSDSSSTAARLKKPVGWLRK
jgi:hypothetical protein